MKTWDQVIKDGLYYLLHADRFAYFYGAKGTYLSESAMQALWDAEPSYFRKYSEADKKYIFDYSRGKIGYDCSGFIAKLTGCNTYSGAIWSRCTDKTLNPFEGPAGSILWKPGHVGLDIGYGYYIAFNSEGHSCQLGRISENVIKWEGSGKLSGYIDYEGATNR